MRNAELDEVGYVQVSRSKTAKLFEASARVGAILSGASPSIEEACATYGQAMGTAFQIIDDVLDYAGDASILGKSLGDDLREGKATLPIIAAMQRGTEAQRTLIKSAIETGDMSSLDEVLAIVKSTGALDAARTAAHSEATRAIDAVKHLPDGPHKDCLIQLSAQLLERNH
jgi:octaprenyl-diphosphate synthase